MTTILSPIRSFFYCLFFTLSGLAMSHNDHAADAVETCTNCKIDYFDEEFTNACTNAIETALIRAKHHQSRGFYAMHYYFLLRISQGFGRLFNWSLAEIKLGGKKRYLIAARVIISEADKNIVPGNGPESPFEKGNNFWWINWHNGAFIGGTLFFIADEDLNNFLHVAPKDNLSEKEMNFLVKGDIRLTKIGEKLFVYNPRINHEETNFSYEVKVIGDEFEEFNLVNPIKSHESYGNNWGVLDINEQGFVYLDWFYANGVKLKKIIDGTVQERVLSYQSEEYPIFGDPSGEDLRRNAGVMPYFSFGSNHIKTDQGFVGVGHLKIPTDLAKRYTEGSAIENFRKELYRDFKAKYGQRYVRHDAQIGPDHRGGFNYLLYFYVLKTDDDMNPLKMRISNGFLPLTIDNKGDNSGYKFSLVFPMGVASRESQLLVSCGYGDYSSMLLTIDMDSVLALCRHDVTHLNLRDFSYKIIAVDYEGNVAFGSSLREILLRKEIKKHCDAEECENVAEAHCNKCKNAFYCSKEHQVAHWKQEHKFHCKN